MRTLPSSKDTDYLYASMRIRALETRLLSEQSAQRLIEAKSDEELQKLLADSGYEVEKDEGFSPASLDGLVMRERQKTFSLLRSIAPDPALLDFLLFPYDYHNLKVALKAELTGQEPDRLFMDAGTLPARKLGAALLSRSFEGYTPDMREGAMEALETYARTRDPQQVDIILDRRCFADMKRAARESGSDFAVEYVTRLIDLTNLKAYFRLKRMERSPEFANRVFVGGGFVERTTLESLYEQQPEVFVQTLAYTPYGEIAKSGASLYRQPGGMARLELLCDNYVMEYLKKAKYVPFGFQILLGYAAAKESEYVALRIILAGRRGGLSATEITERLRLSYV